MNWQIGGAELARQKFPSLAASQGEKLLSAYQSLFGRSILLKGYRCREVQALAVEEKPDSSEGG